MKTTSLSTSRDLLVQLLREELRSRKLAQVLHNIGVNDNPYIVTLNEPIAQLLQLKTDEEFRQYDVVMDEHARKVTDDQVSLTNEVTTITRKLELISSTLGRKATNR